MSNKEIVKKSDSEKEWVKNEICEFIKKSLDSKYGSNKYYVDTEVALPYGCDLSNLSLNYTDKIKGQIREEKVLNLQDSSSIIINKWNVDLFIGEYDENNKEIIKPRIIIEAKYNTVNLHEPIVYNYNALLHKRLYPGLRYGFILGNSQYKNIDIPKQLINFGDNFDFIFVSDDENEDKLKLDLKNKKDKLLEVIIKNIKYAKDIEELLTNKKDRTKYWYISNELHSNND